VLTNAALMCIPVDLPVRASYQTGTIRWILDVAMCNALWYICTCFCVFKWNVQGGYKEDSTGPVRNHKWTSFDVQLTVKDNEIVREHYRVIYSFSVHTATPVNWDTESVKIKMIKMKFIFCFIALN